MKKKFENGKPDYIFELSCLSEFHIIEIID